MNHRTAFVTLLLGAALPALAAPPATKPAPPAAAAPVATPAAAVATPAVVDATPIVIPAAIPQAQRDLIRIEVLLDRAHFSPGVIDGRAGGNLALAISAYQAANNLPVDGKPSAALLEKLTANDGANSMQRYTIADADVAGPFVAKLPTDMTELSKLDSPAYANSVEELAERFHMDEPLLRALNPGADFDKAGTVLTVAAISADKLGSAVQKIEVDKSKNAVRAYSADGTLLATYPATVGSTERPAPDGEWAVRTVAPAPDYTFDPKRLTFGKPGQGKLTIKAGPNNPVGSTWIALTKETYGIHGTPDPRLIGKRASHGCVRLTNWDAHQLGASVKAGAKVIFTGSETRSS